MNQGQLTQLCVSAVVDAVASNNQMLTAQVCESNLTSDSLQQLTHEWTSSEHANALPILYITPKEASNPAPLPPGYTSYIILPNALPPPGTKRPSQDPFSATSLNGWYAIVNPDQGLQIILTDIQDNNTTQAQADMATFISYYIAPDVKGTDTFSGFSSNLVTQVLAALNGAWNPGTNSNSPEQMNTIQSFLSIVTSRGSYEETPLQTMERNIISAIQQNPSQLSTIAQIGSAMNNLNSQTITLLAG